MYESTRTLVLAAANSSMQDRLAADFCCDGCHDEKVFNMAIGELVHGGTLRLSDGDYIIDGFDQEDHAAIIFGYNGGNARVINVVGSTENKSYNTHFGVALHVSEAAFESMAEHNQYRVFYGTGKRPSAPGDFYTMTHVNNVNLGNFYLYFPHAGKPLIGIDCRNFGSSHIHQVGIYTERYFEDRFLHRKPATPVPGTIGIYTTPGSNDEMARIGFDTVNVGGLHTGFYFNQIDHLIMQTCSAARCCYGYVFDGGPKTLTMLNCCDEGNTHLPHFRGRGHLTSVDFNIERFNADYIPDDPEGNEEPQATEETPGGWHGAMSYTMQGTAFGLRSFWKHGHGNNIRTVNLDHDRCMRPEHPEFLEQYFDRQRNQLLLWNGRCWVDPLGREVDGEA